MRYVKYQNLLFMRIPFEQTLPFTVRSLLPSKKHNGFNLSDGYCEFHLINDAVSNKPIRSRMENSEIRS